MTTICPTNIWTNFIAQVYELNPHSAVILVNNYRCKFFECPEKYIHAHPAEILKRLFAWGDKGSISREHWHGIYIGLGGIPLPDHTATAYPGV